MNYNVVVVGAGPAGASLAILCRLFGLEVALIEASPGRPAPGEALPPGSAEYLKKLGIAERVLPHRLRYDGLEFRWGKLRQAVSCQLGEESSREGFRLSGFQMPRCLLDRALLERASELGVQVFAPVVARSLCTQKGRICGVATNQGDIYGDFVVDAAGGRHWLARKLGMALQFFSPPMYGYYGWAEGLCKERLERPLVMSNQQGWVFTSRIDGDLYQFTRMSFSPLDLPGDWLPIDFRDAKMRAVMPTLGGDGPRLEGRLRGADLTWRRVYQAAGQGFFICGDAAVRTDPVGQQGVFKSLVAGFQCALALQRIFHGGVPEEEARNAYSDWVRETYIRDLATVKETYRRHPYAPEWLQGDSAVRTGHLEPEAAGEPASVGSSV